MTDPHLVTAIALLAQDPAAGFAAAEAAARPEVVERGLRFLNLAYTAVWIVLAAYLFSLSVRLRRLSLQIRRLKEKLGV